MHTERHAARVVEKRRGAVVYRIGYSTLCSVKGPRIFNDGPIASRGLCGRPHKSSRVRLKNARQLQSRTSTWAPRACTQGSGILKASALMPLNGAQSKQRNQSSRCNNVHDGERYCTRTLLYPLLSAADQSRSLAVHNPIRPQQLKPIASINAHKLTGADRYIHSRC